MYMWIHTHLFIIETVTLLDYVHVKVQINSQVFTLCTCVDRLFALDTPAIPELLTSNSLGVCYTMKSLG